MPTAMIDRDQRDGLYELVRNHLGSIGDVWLALEENEDMPTSGNGLEGYICHSVRVRLLANYRRICGDIDYYENLLALRVPDFGPKVQMPMGPVECLGTCTHLDSRSGNSFSHCPGGRA